MFAIDHVITVVEDLDAAGERLLDEHGLASRAGGRHPGHGTGNRIVPLGDAYLELMAVVDPEEAEDSPLGRWAIAHASDDFRISAVCIRTDDILDAAGALGEEPLALSWRLAGLEGMIRHGAPFFIQWDTDEHPGGFDVDHRVEPRGITRVGIPDAPSAVLGILRTTPGVSLGSLRLGATIRTADGTIDL